MPRLPPHTPHKTHIQMLRSIRDEANPFFHVTGQRGYVEGGKTLRALARHKYIYLSAKGQWVLKARGRLALEKADEKDGLLKKDAVA